MNEVVESYFAASKSRMMNIILQSHVSFVLLVNASAIFRLALNNIIDNQ